MTTGLTIGVLGIAAAGIAVAAMAVMRALAKPRIESMQIAAAPSLSDPDEPSLSPQQKRRDLRTSAPDPAITDPGESELPRHSFTHHASYSPPTIPPSEDYDPALENEDDVPTTLFRDSDAEEIDAMLADMDSDGGER